MVSYSIGREALRKKNVKELKKETIRRNNQENDEEVQAKSLKEAALRTALYEILKKL